MDCSNLFFFFFFLFCFFCFCFFLFCFFCFVGAFCCVGGCGGEGEDEKKEEEEHPWERERRGEEREERGREGKERFPPSFTSENRQQSKKGEEERIRIITNFGFFPSLSFLVKARKRKKRREKERKERKREKRKEKKRGEDGEVRCERSSISDSRGFSCFEFY